MAEKSSLPLSVRKGEMVRGYEVRRLPLGEYLTALDALREAPAALMRACFPGEDASQVLTRLSHIGPDGLTKLLERAMAVVPGEAVRLLSLLTGVSQEALLRDPDIGLDGLAEMLEAFWRLNGLENFTKAALRAAAALKSARTGFSA